ncbi:hypothetical protein MKW98_006762 [Papaver atlanticum]|uniref:PUM-HD domain-containing protein n=1 Tax=Papaver atlanticum TaxID=357466 RepID=A0AAD4XQA6_9MAGN|nr:hypothetical protein MKW98_006762 [Papaver atlanticum]
MVIENPLQMYSDLELMKRRYRNGMGGGSNGNNIIEDSLSKEIELIMTRRERLEKEIVDKQRGASICRSGSAPPTVEGSLNAFDSLFSTRNNFDVVGVGINRNGMNSHGNVISSSEEELRSHPAYHSYYYSHENHNPRLPPPSMSKEDWRIAQRVQAFGGIGDRRKEDLIRNYSSKSLFSLQPGSSTENGQTDLVRVKSRNFADQQQQQPSAEWLERETDGLIGLGLGEKRKSLANMIQEGLGEPTPISGHLSRPVSRNAFSDVDPMGTPDSEVTQFHSGLNSIDGIHSRSTTPGLVRVHSSGSSLSHTFALAVGSSIPRSTTPESQIAARAIGPGLPPVGGRGSLVDQKNVLDANTFNGLPSSTEDRASIAASLSGLSLSKTRLVDEVGHNLSQLKREFDVQPSFHIGMPNDHSQSLQKHLVKKTEAVTLPIPSIYKELANKNDNLTDASVCEMNSNAQPNFRKGTSASANVYKKGPYAGPASFDQAVRYQSTDMPDRSLSGHMPETYPINDGQDSVNHYDTGASFISSTGRSLDGNRNQVRSGPQVPIVDPLYVQCMQRASDYTAQAATSPTDPFSGRNYSHVDMIALHRAYLEALIAQQNPYGMPFLDKSSSLIHPYLRSPAFGHSMKHYRNLMARSIPSVVSGSPMLQNQRISSFPSMLRGTTGGSLGSWLSGDGEKIEESYGSSLLEEFKTNKARSFELSEIVDYVVEFSADQYGSRFIQTKLESATVEEKNKIFPKIIPHARNLMTDVFGNYVIQKFFEHGTESQRKELSDQLTGHVLPLSLQMYGCRVIQKALEVVDVDQQTRMVAELDGSIMKCVRDQNGNHVIQKCIECVPQDRIQFIISSFYGQVVSLSTHPYGCRVIQRVLEHCDDVKTQHIIMEDIMHSVCTLAQDQYGNYVVQHVLEHGKPHERSAIINKLSGLIVKMSQQKFASNVVEKCLTFAGPEERQVLVKEMLGSTEENEPLQAMMKDQFGNYVVQKVLETCDNHSCELILSRVRVHLNTLKRYTYGKHIVARVEKLVTAGERCIGMSSLCSA